MSDPALLEALKANVKYPEVVKAILAEKDLDHGQALIWAAYNSNQDLVKAIITQLGPARCNFTYIEVWAAFFVAQDKLSPTGVMKAVDITGPFLAIQKGSPEKMDLEAARLGFAMASTFLEKQRASLPSTQPSS